MRISIGSNISSLKAQRQLGKVTNEVTTLYERLSSGQRINKASDDAAGLSIVSSLTSDRRIFNQGIKNLNDGVSMLNIADGAIQQLSSIVIRLKELTEQAANGTYGRKQREALNEEAQALSKEYTRIAQSTSFNGRSLFNGSVESVRLQGGVGLDGSILSGVGGAIGTGTFEDALKFDSNNIIHIATADFNNDGISDVLTSDATNDQYKVFLGKGDGTLQLVSSFFNGSSAGDSVVTIADFNNDGILDFAGANSAANGPLNVFLGNGAGSFTLVTSSAISEFTRSLVSGDFNGDGYIDLVRGRQFLELHLGDGTGNFSSATTISDPASFSTDSMVVGDFNGDGIDDVAAAGYNSSPYGTHAVIFLGTSSGTFVNSATYLVGAGTYYGPDIETGDFNGDGILDLVTANYYAETISVLVGKGDGTFEGPVSYRPDLDNINSVAVGDFNGDGHDDIAIGGYEVSPGNRIRIIYGNGSGSFSAGICFHTEGSNLAQLSTGDFNQDGVVDLIGSTGFYDSGNAFVFLGEKANGVGPLLPFDLSTVAGARQALPVFEKKLQQLATQRGTIGAFQSRISVAVSVLEASSDNYAAAAGRIKDADIAGDSAKLVRTQILQQAAVAVLSQANLQPALAVDLLKAPSG